MSPDELVKAAPPPVHINLRVTGQDVAVLEELRRLAPGITDSQRLRDAARLAVFVVLKQRAGERIPPHLADHLGVFR